ncbi:MAG: hypothetical protein ABW252_13520 [Polyangiales bacterium]
MAQVVFVVHGIGSDAGTRATPASDWSADIARTLRGAAGAYPGIDPKQLVIEPILYDDVFQRHARNWQELAQALRGTPLERATALLSTAAEGEFLWGSLGDVVQYRGLPMVRKNVHTAVAAKIAEAVAKHGIAHHYSVLAHSLGTAVAHDAISALATRSVEGSTALHPPNFRFANFFTLANVSRLVWATTGDFYAKSRVRPRDSGLADDACPVDHYLDFRHVADPIPSIVRFAPRGWSSSHCQQKTVRHLNDLNVHGFVHYLQSPQVSDRILARLFPAAMQPDVFRARIAPTRDLIDPLAAAKAQVVASVENLLDGLSAQALGDLELDLGRMAEALWKSRDLLREVAS